MKCLVVGCGSIGSRRARLLAEMGHEVAVLDDNLEREAALASEVGRHAPWIAPDASFVCTPAHTHVEVAQLCLLSRGLFIEKPLSVSMDGVAELVAECEAGGVVTMGACNMRWAYPGSVDGRPGYGRLGLGIEDCRPLTEWRHGAVSAYSESGIVLEAGTHWLDLASHLVGAIADIVVRDSADGMVRLTLHHDGGTSTEMVLDWRADAHTTRVVVADTPTGLVVLDEDTSDDMYRLEMAHFLDSVANGAMTCNPITNAAETLRWALKARDMTRRVAV